MQVHIAESGIDAGQVCVVATVAEFGNDDKTYFAVATRQYRKTGSEAEYNRCTTYCRTALSLSHC